MACAARSATEGSGVRRLSLLVQYCCPRLFHRTGTLCAQPNNEAISEAGIVSYVCFALVVANGAVRVYTDPAKSGVFVVFAGRLSPHCKEALHSPWSRSLGPTVPRDCRGNASPPPQHIRFPIGQRVIIEIACAGSGFSRILQENLHLTMTPSHS